MTVSGIYTPSENDVTPSGHGPSAIGSADVVKEALLKINQLIEAEDQHDLKTVNPEWLVRTLWRIKQITNDALRILNDPVV